MIKIFTSIEEIIPLLKEEDEENLLCSKGEWIQWLSSIVSNKELFLILGLYDNDDGEFEGYIVAQNAVMPPMSFSIYIYYMSEIYDDELKEEVKEILINWAKTKGAKNINCLSSNVNQLKEYGFQDSGMRLMEFKI